MQTLQIPTATNVAKKSKANNFSENLKRIADAIPSDMKYSFENEDSRTCLIIQAIVLGGEKVSIKCWENPLVPGSYMWTVRHDKSNFMPLVLRMGGGTEKEVAHQINDFIFYNSL